MTNETSKILLLDSNLPRAEGLSFQLNQFGFNYILIRKDIVDFDLTNVDLIIFNCDNNKVDFSNIVCPIIFLSSQNDEPIIAGKDRIIIKPYHIQILIETLKQINTIALLQFNEFIFSENLKTLENSSNNEVIKLTDSESRIIRLLIENQTGVNKDILLQSALKYNPEVDTHTIETHIYRLRKKLLALNLDIIAEGSNYKLNKN